MKKAVRLAGFLVLFGILLCACQPRDRGPTWTLLGATCGSSGAGQVQIESDRAFDASSLLVAAETDSPSGNNNTMFACSPGSGTATQATCGFGLLNDGWKYLKVCAVFPGTNAGRPLCKYVGGFEESIEQACSPRNALGDWTPSGVGNPAWTIETITCAAQPGRAVPDVIMVLNSRLNVPGITAQAVLYDRADDETWTLITCSAQAGSNTRFQCGPFAPPTEHPGRLVVTATYPGYFDGRQVETVAAEDFSTALEVNCGGMFHGQTAPAGTPEFTVVPACDPTLPWYTFTANWEPASYSIYRVDQVGVGIVPCEPLTAENTSCGGLIPSADGLIHLSFVHRDGMDETNHYVDVIPPVCNTTYLNQSVVPLVASTVASYWSVRNVACLADGSIEFNVDTGVSGIVQRAACTSDSADCAAGASARYFCDNTTRTPGLVYCYGPKPSGRPGLRFCIRTADMAEADPAICRVFDDFPSLVDRCVPPPAPPPPDVYVQPPFDCAATYAQDQKACKVDARCNWDDKNASCANR